MCVRMVDMRMDVIMIENMILAMSRYFILEKMVDNEYKQIFGIRHYQV